MIIGKSKRELGENASGGQLAGLVLQELRHLVGVGVTTLEIDAPRKR